MNTGFTVRDVVISLVVIAMFSMVVTWAHRNWYAPRSEDRKVAKLIDSLSSRSALGLSAKQWSTAVGWTRNLHGNSLLHSEAPADAIRAFRKRLEGRLSEEIDLETILWIWREYADLTPHGKHYYRTYSSRMLDEIMVIEGASGPRQLPKKTRRFSLANEKHLQPSCNY